MPEHTNDTQRLTSYRALAAAIDRTPSTALAWTRHPDWPFSRSAPWSSADVLPMQRWADEALRRDRADETPADDFWATVRAAAPLPSCYDPDGDDEPLPLDEWPEQVVGPRERRLILDGLASSDPTVRAMATAMRQGVELRAWQLHFAAWVGKRLGAADRERRVRCWVQEDITNASAEIERLLAAKPRKRPGAAKESR